MYMKFRALQEKDISRVARWNIELHEDEGSTPMSISEATERLGSWLASGRFRGMVFMLDNVDVGYVLYELQAANADIRGSVDSIYVRQFYITRESRRSGLGTEAFRNFLREMGDKRVTLEVKATNPNGQRFWESLGFTPQEIAYQLN